MIKTYRVFVDYNTEGYHLQEQEYPTVNEAVQDTLNRCLGNKFIVVQIINWVANDDK